MFNWDNDKSSKKLNIDDDQLTVKVKDGSGFKTSLGDSVMPLFNLNKLLAISARRALLFPTQTESGTSGQDWSQQEGRTV